MALGIYKPGQGYWTRVLSAAGGGAVVLAGVGYVWEQMSVIQDDTIYWQAGVAVGIIAFFGALMFFLLNKPNIVDFMIATEAEMKKVHWPSRKELIGSTLVVIWGTVIFAAILFIINLFFGWLFLELGILEAATGT